jgi:hypothetical protein
MPPTVLNVDKFSSYFHEPFDGGRTIAFGDPSLLYTHQMTGLYRHNFQVQDKRFVQSQLAQFIQQIAIP